MVNIRVYRFALNLILFALLGSALSCGGGGGGGDAGQNNNQNQEPDPSQDQPDDNTSDNNDVDCSVTLVSILQNIHLNMPDNIPSWEQLACYTNNLSRIEEVQFSFAAANSPPVENFNPSDPATPWELIEESESFYEGWPQSTLQDFRTNEVPPYLSNNGEGYSEAQWDQKLRGIAAYGLYLKSLGYRLKVDFFYPPSLFEPGNGVYPEMNTQEDFLTWWRDDYIPERVRLAEVAELVQAEYLQPWDIEPGQFVRAFGELWLDDLSETEQVVVTQTAIDELYVALRPVFTGTLIVITYDRYAAHGDYWQQVDLSAWDQVNFALFTEGDVEATEAYLTEQLNGYLAMVENFEIERWTLQEITVNPDAHQRLLEEGVQFSDIEADIYSAIFDAVDNLSVQPQGLGITVGNIQQAETENIVKTRIASLMGNN